MRATPKPSAGPPCQTSNSGLAFAASRRATVSPDERRTNFVETPVSFVKAPVIAPHQASVAPQTTVKLPLNLRVGV